MSDNFTELRRQSYRTAQSQTRTEAITQPSTSRDNILTSLSNFADSALGFMDQKAKAKLESDRAIGAAKAAQDLLVASDAREGVTQEDSDTVKLAYNSIVGQHDVIEAGNQFTEWYQSNPTASDDEIYKKKQDLYTPLFTKYGADDRSLKQVSLQIQESQFSLTRVQKEIKSKYDAQQAEEAINISINDLLADPNADVAAVVQNEIPARAGSLKLGEFQYKSALMASAQTRARDGDPRLLRQLEKEPWAKGSAALQKANSDYDRFVAEEKAPVIGDAMANIEQENVTGSVPWYTTLRKIEQLNDQFPNTYSPERIASLKKARQTALDKKSKVNSGIRDSYDIYTNNNKLPLALDPSYTPNDKKDIVSDLEGSWKNRYSELLAAGKSEEEASDAITNDKLKWSRLNRVVVPSLKETVNAVMNLNDAELAANDGNLPDFAINGLNLFKKMDSSAVELYLPSEQDQAFVSNFKQFSQQLPDDAAYQRAMRIKRNPYKVTSEQRTEQADSTRRAVDKFLDSSSWYENLFGQGESLVNLDVPSWQKDQLRSQWAADVESRLYAGGMNTDTNAEDVIKAKMSRMSQIPNGTLINIPMPELNSIMSRNAESPIPINKTGDYVEAYMLASSKFINKAYGRDIPVENLRLEFDRGGETFRFFDSNNEPIGGRILTESMYDVGRQYNLDELRKLQEDARTLRNERANRERTERFLPYNQ